MEKIRVSEMEKIRVSEMEKIRVSERRSWRAQISACLAVCLMLLLLSIIYLLPVVVLSYQKTELRICGVSDFSENCLGESYPNPMEEFQACGVKNFSYICDPSQQLSEYEIQQLNHRIELQRSGNSCLTIMVALVPRIKYSTGGFPDTDDEAELTAARRFAEHLRDTSWSIKNDSCGRQAYIVHDMYTRRVWTAINEDGRKVITDERATAVARSVKKEYLQHRMIYQGIDDMISKYNRFLEDAPRELPWWSTHSFILLLFVVFVTALEIRFCPKRRGEAVGGGGVVYDDDDDDDDDKLLMP